MATSALCTTCDRMVYISVGEDRACPVCSSTLMETVDETAEA